MARPFKLPEMTIMRRIVAPLVLLILMSNLALVAVVMGGVKHELLENDHLSWDVASGEAAGTGRIAGSVAEPARERILRQAYIAVIFCGLLASVIAFFVAWRIASPLVRMRDVVVAKGLQTRAEDLPLDVEGEVGELAESIRAFLQELRYRQQLLEQEIVHRKLAQAHLEVKNTQLEFANKESEQFVYIASHDLQEPVRTVRSFAQMLAGDYGSQLDENGRRVLEFIEQSTVRMSELIKGLLDYSRIGKRGEPHAVNMQTVLDAICADLDARIQEKQAVIEYHGLPEVQGFETDLRALLQNLITNALKFTQRDRPPIVRIAADRDDRDWVFSVADNGIGIAEEHFEKIFLIFQRLHARDGYEGSGIGLAHCKKIIELHGGKIWLESTPGEGTTFYFTIRDLEPLPDESATTEL